MKITKTYLRTLIEQHLKENTGQTIFVVMQGNEIFGVYSDIEKAKIAKGEQDRTIFQGILNTDNFSYIEAE